MKKDKQPREDSRTSDPDRTAFIIPGSDLEVKQKALLPKGVRPILVCLQGNQRGLRFAIEKQETILGRSRDVDFLIDDMQSSRKHLKLIYTNLEDRSNYPVCTIQDLKSRNGTFLNGYPLEEVTTLSDSDRIRVGRTVFGFFVRDEMEISHQESMYRRATRDPLTGLLNRIQVEEELDRVISIALDKERPMSMLLMDIDNFKSINDEHGHLTGDLVLKHMAEIIMQQIGKKDFAGRWGGEEFAYVAPGKDLKQAVALAECIRDEVETVPFRSQSDEIHLTVSIGVVELSEVTSTDQLFQIADERLYSAKRGGRNLVIPRQEDL